MFSTAPLIIENRFKQKLAQLSDFSDVIVLKKKKLHFLLQTQISSSDRRPIVPSSGELL